MEDDYSQMRWITSEPVFYEVRDGFPRVDLPLKHGVEKLKYSIALAACEPFKTATPEVRATISAGYLNGALNG